MNASEALALVQRLLVDALQEKPASATYVRDLAGHIGDLRGTMRSALTVIELATEEAGR
ncbi:hypothetical protein HRW23_22060 [Streptomyces lunaelactis]|uniref:hypothetical protein n=1 Tax=Streptomyces lunaelactis TaxID=1535768 RepID=UPI001585A96E|nr:hypothetical protein [Streptomyces lunaelactis]NUK72125.1 hypothetical protein [Streptomyces lunaelactis]NUK80033.1 hypothetical protein [Streptomyces lunaelactis]